MSSIKSGFFPFFAVILVLTLVVPVIVLPMVLDNAFNTPKTSLMILGVIVMAGIYCFRFFLGKRVLRARTSTPQLVLFLVILNLFSCFYTGNPYYTIHAATMNITCLFLFYVASLCVNGRNAFLLMTAAAVSGFLVCVEVYLQFFGIFILFKWAHHGIMVMGTIGNSNYLGAYLIFPLYAVAALIFLVRGKLRLILIGTFIFIVGALLFSRARAGWFGFFLSLPIFLLLMKKIYKVSVFDHLRSKARASLTSAVVLLSLLVSLWHIAPSRFHGMMDYKNITRSDTLKLRMEKYSRASLWLFKQSPLFGTGLWSFRNMVFLAQAEINQVDTSFFKDYPEPKPESVHNEWLEIFNDGGLLGAAAVVFFLIAVMRHGWKIIKDNDLVTQTRIIAAAAFSSIVAIMLAALFFFPFRINSTLFMTVLMMGVLEGLYTSSYGLLSGEIRPRSSVNSVLLSLVFCVLIGFGWYRAIKPFKAEMEYFQYKQALGRGDGKEAVKRILRAIEYDPHNSAYCLYASQLYMNVFKDYGKASDFIEKAIVDYNGDLTMYSLYFIKGLLKLQAGSLFEAQTAFEKSLYFNPEFEEAQRKLEETKRIIKDTDRVMIKFK